MPKVKRAKRHSIRGGGPIWDKVKKGGKTLGKYALGAAALGGIGYAGYKGLQKGQETAKNTTGIDYSRYDDNTLPFSGYDRTGADVTYEPSQRSKPHKQRFNETKKTTFPTGNMQVDLLSNLLKSFQASDQSGGSLRHHKSYHTLGSGKISPTKLKKLHHLSSCQHCQHSQQGKGIWSKIKKAAKYVLPVAGTAAAAGGAYLVGQHLGKNGRNNYNKGLSNSGVGNRPYAEPKGRTETFINDVNGQVDREILDSQPWSIGGYDF